MSEEVVETYHPLISGEEYVEKLAPLLISSLLNQELQPLRNFIDLQTITCSLCLDYFQSSVIIHKCGQMLCAEHFNLNARRDFQDNNGMQNCLHCRESYSYPHKPISLVLLKDIRDALQTMCLNCSQTMKHGQFEHHIFKECDQFVCPVNHDCGRVIAVSDANEHQITTTLRKFEPTVQHIMFDCEYKAVACAGRDYGCTWTGILKNYLKNHAKTCNFATIYKINQKEQIEIIEIADEKMLEKEQEFKFEYHFNKVTNELVQRRNSEKKSQEDHTHSFKSMKDWFTTKPPINEKKNKLNEQKTK
jgi:hypothetical protein